MIISPSFFLQEKSPIVGHDTYRQLAEKESNLQKQVIKLSEENLELRFEVEQAHKDIPRLKVCIQSPVFCECAPGSCVSQLDINILKFVISGYSSKFSIFFKVTEMMFDA